MSHVIEGVAPTAVAERVSDDDDVEDAKKLGAVHPVRDGYCQCENRAVPAGHVVDRKPANLPRHFRAIQRSVTASKMVPRPLRSASVDRHCDGWSGITSVKYQPSGGPAACSRYGGSNAYRVSTPTDMVVLRGQARSFRRHATTPPPREVSRATDWAVMMQRLAGGTAPQAAVDSDLASDFSDLDHDIIDDLHLAESMPGFTRRVCRSTDTLRATTSTDSTDSQPSRHQNGWIQTDSTPVVLRRSSAQEQTRGVTGTPRTQRAGSYHGSVHHSITLSELSSLQRMGVANRSPVGSLKNALANFAGRWSKAGRKASASKSDLSSADDGRTGCVAEHGAGLMSRIVARASCRLPRNRSKSSDRCEGARSVAVCGGRVTVSAVTLRHDDDTRSSSKTTTIYGDGPVIGESANNTDQRYVPYIDDSECSESEWS